MARCCRVRSAASPPACGSVTADPGRIRIDQALLDHALDRMLEAWVETFPWMSCSVWTANSRSTSPPGPSLMSSGPDGFLWRAISSRIFAASERVFFRVIAFGPRGSMDRIGQLLTLLRGPVDRARTAERHMLPRPCLAALVVEEPFERTASIPSPPCGLRRVSTS